MKKSNIFLILIIFTQILFNSCSKFKDNDGLNLRSKKARLTNKWKVKEIYNNSNREISINDFVSIMAKKDLSYLGINPGLKFVFENDQSMEFIISAGFSITNRGTWKFVDETGLKVNINSNSSFGIPSINEEYNIIRLTGSELWLEYTKDNITYEIHLKSK
jgi:hypothetical protein